MSGDHPGGANIAAAWALASGAGVSVGVVDSGVNRAHRDLLAPLAVQPADGGTNQTAPIQDPHGTRVAGLISGRVDNDIAGMGVAPEAETQETRITFGTSVDLRSVASALAAQAAHDVSNNSWGFTQAFSDNFLNPGLAPVSDALRLAVTEGRGGLGTVLVMAGGNGRMMIGGVNLGDDSNFHNLTNSRHTIAVGATDVNGKATIFSSPGANLLLSAPGLGLVTADGLEAGAEGQAMVAGTSFSAPLVAGTVALMLEVNPDLGYRDIQKILALTARAAPPDPASGTGGAQANAAEMLNGGGLVFDRDIGFGILDAAAAVRLAAVWEPQSTAANEAMLSARAGPAVTTDGAHYEVIFEVPDTGQGFALTSVELMLSMGGVPLRGLSILLESPSGTLVEIAPNLRQIGSKSLLSFTFSSVATWGEEVSGTWRVILAFPAAMPGFAVQEAQLALFGDLSGQAGHDGGAQYFNAGFSAQALADPGRRVISHHGEAPGALVFAALDRPVSVDLAARGGRIDGVDFTLEGDFARVLGGAGADDLRGGAGADSLSGGDGSDFISGSGGADQLEGEDGNDLLEGGAGKDSLHGGAGDDEIQGGTEADRLYGGAGNDLLLGEGGGDRIYGGAGDDSAYGGTWSDLISGGSGADLLYGDSNSDTLYGGSGDDRLYGGTGSDVIQGGGGMDSAFGGSGNDLIHGDTNKDVLYGESGADTLYGGSNNDTIYGGSGDDVIDAGTGSDRVYGGSGADSFVFSTVPSSTNYSRIPDFDPAEDRLLLSRAVFVTSGAEISFEKASYAKGAGSVLLWDAETGLLHWDADGVGPQAAIRMALLSPGLDLSADDILLI